MCPAVVPTEGTQKWTSQLGEELGVLQPWSPWFIELPEYFGYQVRLFILCSALIPWDFSPSACHEAFHFQSFTSPPDGLCHSTLTIILSVMASRDAISFLKLEAEVA